jgi:plastocyanin
MERTRVEVKKGYQGRDSVENAGTITGTVSYAGSKTDGTITITKDKAVCEHQKTEIRPKGSILVNNGKLKNAVVYLADVKEGLKASKKDIQIDNLECTFVPRVQVGIVGSRVISKNLDNTMHNTHLRLTSSGKDLKNMALPKKGQVGKMKAKLRGLYDVQCDAHPWMQGYVMVVNHPYAVVTGDDGSFSLPNVVAGDYKLRVWHEEFGEQTARVTVRENGTVKQDITFN